MTHVSFITIRQESMKMMVQLPTIHLPMKRSPVERVQMEQPVMELVSMGQGLQEAQKVHRNDVLSVVAQFLKNPCKNADIHANI